MVAFQTKSNQKMICIHSKISVIISVISESLKITKSMKIQEQRTNWNRMRKAKSINKDLKFNRYIKNILISLYSMLKLSNYSRITCKGRETKWWTKLIKMSPDHKVHITWN